MWENIWIITYPTYSHIIINESHETSLNLRSGSTEFVVPLTWDPGEVRKILMASTAEPPFFHYLSLVGLTILKNMKVNGKDDIPYNMEHIPNHQPAH